MAAAAVATMPVYSQPPLKTRNPLSLWSVRAAVAMRPMAPAAGNGLRAPTVIRAPAPISVPAPSPACRVPGRRPRVSKYLAVPASPPPPKILL